MKQPEDWYTEIQNDPGKAADLTQLIADIQEDAFRAGIAHCCQRLNNATTVAAKEDLMKVLAIEGRATREHWLTKAFLAQDIHDTPRHCNDIY